MGKNLKAYKDGGENRAYWAKRAAVEANRVPRPEPAQCRQRDERNRDRRT